MEKLARLSAALGLALALAACPGRQPRFPHAVLTPGAPVTLPAATLVGDAGKPFTLDGLKGKWVWLYFGYTNCPDVCPLAMDYMADEYKRLKDPKAVQVVFVSVDPKRDDPKRVMAFARFHNPAFMGVSGPDPVLASLTHALNASYVLDKPEKPGGNYGVSHTNLIFLLDPQGRQVATYVPGTNPGEMAADMNALVAQGAP
jgi:protein SCO1/2